MDDSLQELEAELKSLSLRRPGPPLADSIARELAEPTVSPARPHYTTSTNLSTWKWLGWRTAGVAAAALAIVAILNIKPAPAATPSVQVAATVPVKSGPVTAAARDGYQPVAATNVLYDMKDEGLVKAEDDTSARRLRYRYLDTYTWKNAKTNASIKWSVPRDEIRLVSATLN